MEKINNTAPPTLTVHVDGSRTHTLVTPYSVTQDSSFALAFMKLSEPAFMHTLTSFSN